MDPMGTSRQASELLSELREQASRRGWKQTSKSRVSIDEVWLAFYQVPAVNPDGEYERLVLNRLLDEMEQAGAVARLRTHDREKIPLPVAIWLLPTRAAAAVLAPMPPWHPSLRTFASYWPTATSRQRAAYAAINRWMMAGPDQSPIPIRERALEIFGRRSSAADFPVPEKTFDTLRSGPLFSDSVALHKLVSAFVVHPPLLAERFTEAVGDGYLQQVGSGRRLLVIENATTWWSVVNSLPEKHALGYVAWGLGNTFVSSINTIAQRHQVSEIRYFGDLDLSGLRIPNSAARTARVPARSSCDAE
jgi:hypothetical protein